MRGMKIVGMKDPEPSAPDPGVPIWRSLQPRSLRGPYSSRTSGKRDGAACVRDNSDIPTEIAPSDDRAPVAWMYAPANGAALDLAFRTLTLDRRSSRTIETLMFQLLLDFAQRCPPRIAGMLLAITLLMIQVASALRAQAFAVLATHAL